MEDRGRSGEGWLYLLINVMKAVSDTTEETETRKR